MLKTPLFGFLFFLILFIAILHITAINFFFYWTLWWFDLLMHFLGGFWIVLALLWFLYFSGYFSSFKFKPKAGLKSFLIIALTSSLIVGILWEIFELWGGVTSLSFEYYWTDTLSDILMDFLGGVAAAFFVYRKYEKQESINQNYKNLKETTNV